MFDGGVTTAQQSFRKGRQAHKIVFLYGDHLHIEPLLTGNIELFEGRIYEV